MAAAKKADPSAKPPPDAAAILELLNEITRELTAAAADDAPPPAPPELVTAAASLPESTPLPEPREPAPPPNAQKGRKTARQIGVGVLLAVAYVAIFAAAGLVISRLMHPADEQVASPRRGPRHRGQPERWRSRRDHRAAAGGRRHPGRRPSRSPAPRRRWCAPAARGPAPRARRNGRPRRPGRWNRPPRPPPRSHPARRPNR